MSLETLLITLGERMDGLHERLRRMHLAVTEDSPAEDDVALIMLLSDRCTELTGLLDEARRRAVRAASAARFPADLLRLLPSLVGIQQKLEELSEQLHGQLLDHDMLSELERLGSERGREWAAWSRVIRGLLHGIREQAFETSRAVLPCWRELAERLAERAVATTEAAANEQDARSIPDARETGSVP